MNLQKLFQKLEDREYSKGKIIRVLNRLIDWSSFLFNENQIFSKGNFKQLNNLKELFRNDEQNISLSKSALSYNIDDILND